MKLIDKLTQLFDLWRNDASHIPSKDQPKRIVTTKFTMSKEPDLRKK